MFYLFNYTSGDAQKHLQPRYDKDFLARFNITKEIIDYLAIIYINSNLIRDAKYDYNALVIRRD
jgi:hypothetical protein